MLNKYLKIYNIFISFESGYFILNKKERYIFFTKRCIINENIIFWRAVLKLYT